MGPVLLCREVFDAVVCFEEKVMEQVIEGEQGALAVAVDISRSRMLHPGHKTNSMPTCHQVPAPSWPPRSYQAKLELRTSNTKCTVLYLDVAHHMHLTSLAANKHKSVQALKHSTYDAEHDTCDAEHNSKHC